MVLTRRPEKAKDLISFTESGITIRFSFTLSSFFEKAVSALKTEGFSVTTTQVLAVEINDRPGGLSEAMKALYNDNISVEYMYSAFINTKENTAYLILRVENVTAALEALSEAGFALISQQELASI